MSDGPGSANPAGAKRSSDSPLSPQPIKRIKTDEGSQDILEVAPKESLANDLATVSELSGSSSTKKRDASGYPKSRKGKEKATKNPGRRRGTRAEGEEGEESSGPKEPRLPKRQCALMLGFCGSGYRGMQLYVPSRVLVSLDSLFILHSAREYSQVSQSNSRLKENYSRL